MENPPEEQREQPEELNVRKLSPQAADVAALAPLFQKWAEVCGRFARDEVAPAMRWYLTGMQHANEMAAVRIREILRPTVKDGPQMDFTGLSDAFEAVLKMMSAMHNVTNGETPPASETMERFSNL